jgi:hypothetical protein
VRIKIRKKVQGYDDDRAFRSFVPGDEVVNVGPELGNALTKAGFAVEVLTENDVLGDDFFSDYKEISDDPDSEKRDKMIIPKKKIKRG